MHVWTVVPYPWDPEAPSQSGLSNPWDPAAWSWYIVVVYDLILRAREIMQHRFYTAYARSSWCFEPVRSWNHLLIPSRHVRFVVPNPWESAARPDILYAYSIWCSLLVKYCSPILIPLMHVGTDVPYPWDHAALTWYLVGMYDLMFLTREILQPRPDTF